ncbi:hypothetical protein [Endozoicomonas numazuensis]|uniref:Uncharacterized protein n=1 Tax=Endozoicomonas numazuensis TaxID=1137799 RepID=A0A081NKV9_9GAMM|nr:hypothetical protein [Endozoicomonas numazuensis]KEQ19082.1 hypothetical protein GZ78_03435 [Endozoicomonas numazuensis]
MRIALLFFWYLCCTPWSFANYIPDNELENLSLLIDSLPLSFFGNSQIPEQETIFAYLCSVDKKQLGISPAKFDRCLTLDDQGIIESYSYTYPYKSRKSLYRFFIRNHQNQNDSSPWSFENNKLCYQTFLDGYRTCLIPYIEKKQVERSLSTVYSGSGSGSGEVDNEMNTEPTTPAPGEEDPYKDLKTIGITAAVFITILIVYGIIQGARDYAFKNGYSI